IIYHLFTDYPDTGLMPLAGEILTSALTPIREARSIIVAAPEHRDTPLCCGRGIVILANGKQGCQARAGLPRPLSRPARVAGAFPASRVSSSRACRRAAENSPVSHAIATRD